MSATASVDPLSFIPLFAETMARIRARMDGDVNAGLSTDDPSYNDTREGSFYWDMTQVTGLEIARLWDAIGTETVAAAFPATAWGEYLDNHGLTFGLTRNQPVAATGVETFIGNPGVYIATGTQISTQPADPNADPVTFATTQDGTTGAQITGPAITATASESGGTLGPGTFYYHVTSYNQFGESITGNESAATVAGTTGTVEISWSAVSGAMGYRVYRTITSGAQGLLLWDSAGTGLTTFVDDNSVVPSNLEPLTNLTAGVNIPIIAQNTGSAGNLGAGALNQLATVVSGISSVSNIAQTSGGTDTEDDNPFRVRILGQYASQGAGTVANYESWALEVPGVERAVCIPIAFGPGTVLVIPMLADGSPVASDVVTELQSSLDPDPGLGHGKAPIGAAVTVMTTTTEYITISGTLTFTDGFSLQGDGGTIPTQSSISGALAGYLASLDPGDTIVYQQVLAAFLSVPGVISVADLTVNGASADVPLSTNPPQTPVLGALTLS